MSATRARSGRRVLRSAPGRFAAWLAAATALAATALLALAAPAFGHAVLEETNPGRGATLERRPELVSLRFNEAVEASFGAVRVFDSEGERVDAGEVIRPGGADEVGTRLQANLPDGSYTATYRVISADGHPVSGGFLFTVGEPSGGSAATVGELIDAGEAGAVTELAFGAVRALAYAAIALGIGGLAFLVLVWLPALREASGPADAWRAASERFASRLRRILIAAAVLGAATSALGVLLQGATAAGTSLWSALDPQIVGDVLSTRFGTVWSLRTVGWLTLLLALAVALSPRRAPVLRPAVGAAGLVPARGPSWLVLAILALPLAGIALTPALAGHASTQEPVALLFPIDVLHVLAMSAWLGGLVPLLFAVPAATRQLDGPERTRLLAATLARFSPLALAAVVVLLVSGLVQSYVHVRSLDNLLSTSFGVAVLIKFCLLLGLIALGAVNRQRVIPRLRALAAGENTPGAPGRLLRRTLRAEVALVAVVLGVTAALVSYAPAVTANAGPYSATTELGPARMELTVDPAEVGSNELHIYLLDPQDGSQYTSTEELDVELALPEKEIGPLEVDVRKAGPGHYVAPAAELGVEGEWELEVSARVSEFEAHRASVEVPVE